MSQGGAVNKYFWACECLSQPCFRYIHPRSSEGRLDPESQESGKEVSQQLLPTVPQMSICYQPLLQWEPHLVAARLA